MNAATGTAVASAFAQLPLSFEPNVGQMDPHVRFFARDGAATVLLTDTGIEIVPDSSVNALSAPVAHQGNTALGASGVVSLSPLGANGHPRLEGRDRLPGRVSYLLGNDPGRWRTGIPTYGRVVYREVYPGIDQVFYGRQGRLEYDFVLQPGADPAAIRLRARGAITWIDHAGNLHMRTSSGVVMQQAPVVYQQGTAGRVRVAGRYLMTGSDEVGIAVASYDHHRTLVIDPVVGYATYLGGACVNDSGYAIALDASGNAYIAGATSAPLSAAPHALPGWSKRGWNAFVAKLNPTGTALLYTVYLGGSNDDRGTAIAVDHAGDAFVTGYTDSPNFPTTQGALQRKQRARPFGERSGFVVKLNPTGSTLLYATFLGGNGSDEGTGIAVDRTGDAYVTGATASADFPATASALQRTYGGGGRDTFVAKLDPAGARLLYATFLGGNGWDEGTGIAIDRAGNTYITGWTASADFPDPASIGQGSRRAGLTRRGGVEDAFVAKINPAGSTLIYAARLGGSGNDEGAGIAVDKAGDAYVTGWTASADFPVTPNAVQHTYGGDEDAFVAKLDPAGATLLYATYLGGPRDDRGTAIAVDGSGDTFVTGETEWPNFPVSSSALQQTYGGQGDAFVATLNRTCNALLYGTYLGSSGGDEGTGIAVDSSGDAYVTGLTAPIQEQFPSGFPTSPGAVQRAYAGGTQFGDGNAFIARIMIHGQ